MNISSMIGRISNGSHGRFLEKKLSEWIVLFEKSNKVPFGPINDMKGVFENEQVGQFKIRYSETFDSIQVRHLNQVLEMKNPNRKKSVRVIGIDHHGVHFLIACFSSRSISQFRRYWEIIYTSSFCSNSRRTYTFDSPEWAQLHHRTDWSTSTRENHSIDHSVVFGVFL